VEVTIQLKRGPVKSTPSGFVRFSQRSRVAVRCPASAAMARPANARGNRSNAAKPTRAIMVGAALQFGTYA